MDIEIRADGTLHIEGYVNAVERDSRTVICPECGKCVEQIRAGAFGEALRAAVRKKAQMRRLWHG